MSIASVQARLALLLVLGACARSETYGFVAVLGNDTTSVERVTRTGHRIIGDAIGRSPTVTRRHWEAELGPNGVIAHWSMDTDIHEKRTGLATSLSPRDTVRATVGAADVTVDYSRPSRRGRTLLGDLIPYDQVWRTGANAATQLTTSASIALAGVPLHPGTYTLWTLPTRAGGASRSSSTASPASGARSTTPAATSRAGP